VKHIYVPLARPPILLSAAAGSSAGPAPLTASLSRREAVEGLPARSASTGRRPGAGPGGALSESGC
jgi:hypothetical protein